MGRGKVSVFSFCIVSPHSIYGVVARGGRIAVDDTPKEREGEALNDLEIGFYGYRHEMEFTSGER